MPIEQPRAALLDYQIVERNLRRSLECYALATGRGEIRRMPGVLIASANTSTPVFNSAALTGPPVTDPVELDRRLMIAKVFFEARGLAWCFWLCQELLEPAVRARARAVFERRRLYLASECPGMLAEGVPPLGRPLPPLECRRVAGARERRDFSLITAASFRLPPEATREIYEPERIWESGFVAWVGYLEGRAVGTVATVSVEDAIGLYSVATLPEFRGRGIGEALVRHAVEQARAETGLERVVLQSSREGEPLYRRLGFRPVSRFAIFLSD